MMRKVLPSPFTIPFVIITRAVNTIDSQLYQLRGKSNKLERNADETTSIITNQIFDGNIPDPSQTTSLESQTNNRFLAHRTRLC